MSKDKEQQKEYPAIQPYIQQINVITKVLRGVHPDLDNTGIAAILGNIWGESAFKPDARGDYNKETGIYTSHGLVQWRNNRRDKMYNTIGSSTPSISEQAAYIWQELSTDKAYLKTFKAMTDKGLSVEEKTKVMVENFERPRHPEKDSARRAPVARMILEYLESNPDLEAVSVLPTDYMPTFGYGDGEEALYDLNESKIVGAGTGLKAGAYGEKVPTEHYNFTRPPQNDTINWLYELAIRKKAPTGDLFMEDPIIRGIIKDKFK